MNVNVKGDASWIFELKRVHVRYGNEKSVLFQ